MLAALPQELGPLAVRSGPPEVREAGEAPARHTVQGLALWEQRVGRRPVVTVVAGVGKVRAARAAALALGLAERLRGRPASALLVVGVAGGLRASLGTGTLVHCTRAVQADLAVRAERELAADPGLSAAWREVAAGEAGWFVTADRPVLSPWRRLRLARAFQGPCVADMETAAAAAVAALAGVPWAALRAVSDGAGLLGGAEFRRNFPAQAGRAAATVPALLARLGEEERLS